MDDPLLFISAGDPSGDNATARLIASLKTKSPNLQTIGLGGPRLRTLGQEQLASHTDLAVLGFWEVAKRYLFFRRLFARCIDEIKRSRPKAILLVDYPGFNIRLAKKLKPLGIPVIYYISPQVWAWGKKRLPLLKEYVDRLLVILPFEPEFFKQAGIACDFVGHYLLEDIPADYISSPPRQNRQIALLPGSRRQEIRQMLPAMLQAARRLNKSHGCTAVIAGVEGLDYSGIYDADFDGSIKLSYDDSRKIIYESALVLTASGTATLETGIIGRPMVVVYRTSPLTYMIARRLVKLDNIALCNLVLGESVVPELIQDKATPDNMGEALARYFDDPAYQSNVVAKLKQLPKRLGGVGASEKAAAIVGEYL